MLRRQLRDLVADSSRAAIDAAQDRLVGSGVPEELALAVASGDDLTAALDVVEVASSARISVEEAASVYFAARREPRPALAAGRGRGTAPRQPLAGAVEGGAARRSLRAVERAHPGHAAARRRPGDPGRTREGMARAEPDPGRPVPPDPRRPCGGGTHRLHDAFRGDGARSAPCARESESGHCSRPQVGRRPVGRISRRRNPTSDCRQRRSASRTLSSAPLHVGLRCANPTYALTRKIHRFTTADADLIELSLASQARYVFAALNAARVLAGTAACFASSLCTVKYACAP